MKLIRTAAVLAALSSALLAQAAPTTTETHESLRATEDEASVLPQRSGATGGATGSSTIDLLIDMQPRGAGLQFNERQRTARQGEPRPRQSQVGAADQTTPPGPLAPAANGRRPGVPTTPPSGLFGSGATPAVQSARVPSVDSRFSAGGAADTAPRRTAMSSSGEPLPRWLLWPREVIEYLRENRWLVLGSVGSGLMLIWAISVLLARIARNGGHLPGRSGAGAAFSVDRWGSSRQDPRPTRQRSRRRRH